MGESYTIEDIKKISAPIAKKYGVKRITLFGSYARGEQKSTSDMDFLIEKGAVKGFFMLAGFQRELEEQFSLSIDVLTTGGLNEDFLNRIKSEEIVIYEQ